MRCRSGCHEWLDAASAGYCCNGWKRICVERERIPADAAPEGRVHLRGEFTGLVNVWVPVKVEAVA